jgi:microcystin-dependent protein
MAFYQTRNPTKFVTKDPAISIANKIEYLLSGFQQAGPIQNLVTVGYDGPYTYSASEIINRFTVRKVVDGINAPYDGDVTPSAMDIIEALNANQTVRQTNQYEQGKQIVVYPGFYFDWHILNSTSSINVISAGTGVVLNPEGPINISPNEMKVIRVIVTDVEEGSEQVYMSELVNTTPTGIINPYAGSSGYVPNGWLLCDGSAVSRTTYAKLFYTIGSTYGNGDASTTFNIPDLRGRIPVGLTGAGTYFNTLGGVGGVTDVTLTTAQLASHTHVYNDAYFAENAGGGGTVFGTSAGTDTDNSFYYRTAAGGYSTSPSDLNTSATGAGQSHTNVQPYVTVNYIIKY